MHGAVVVVVLVGRTFAGVVTTAFTSTQTRPTRSQVCVAPQSASQVHPALAVRSTRATVSEKALAPTRTAKARAKSESVGLISGRVSSAGAAMRPEAAVKYLASLFFQGTQLRHLPQRHPGRLGTLHSPRTKPQIRLKGLVEISVDPSYSWGVSRAKPADRSGWSASDKLL